MQDLELEKINKELTASIENLSTIHTTYTKLKECRKLGKLVNIDDKDLRATRWALRRNNLSVESLDLLSLSTESGQLRYSELDLALEGLGDALNKIWNKIKELFKKMFGWLFGKSKETPKEEPIKVPEIKIKVVTKKANGSTTTSEYSLDEAEKGAKVALLKIEELRKKAEEIENDGQNTLTSYINLKNTSTMYHDHKDGDIIRDFDKEININSLDYGIKLTTNIIENCLGGCSPSQFMILLDKLDAEVLEVLNKEMKPMGTVDASAVSADYAELVKYKLGNFIKSTNNFLRENVDKTIIESHTDDVLRISGDFSAGFVRYKKDRLSFTEGVGSNSIPLNLYAAKFIQSQHKQVGIEIELPALKLISKLNPILQFQYRLVRAINNNREYINKSIKEVEKKVNKLISDIKPLLDYPPNQNTSYAVKIYLHILQEIGTFVTMNINTAININNKFLSKMSKEIGQLLNIKKPS